jgi:hypothetical protein
MILRPNKSLVHNAYRCHASCCAPGAPSAGVAHHQTLAELDYAPYLETIISGLGDIAVGLAPLGSKTIPESTRKSHLKLVLVVMGVATILGVSLYFLFSL